MDESKPTGAEGGAPATPSGIPLKEVYLPDDLEWFDYYLDSGFPGEFPFTRGPYPDMYRGRLWDACLSLGEGVPRVGNERLLKLLAAGHRSVRLDFDTPTSIGLDPGHPDASGRAGAGGLSVGSLADMETVFEGVPLESVQPFLAADGTAAVILAMYAALARKRKTSTRELKGTVANDPLGAICLGLPCLLPPADAVRLSADVIAYCARELPLFHPLCVRAHRYRDRGAAAHQEAALGLAAGLEYVGAANAAGLAVDDFAPRLTFSFSAGGRLFEEAAKFRAARRIWARLMRDRWSPASSSSCRLRCHACLRGGSRPGEPAGVGAGRETLAALAAVLGGAQTLHDGRLGDGDAEWPRMLADILARGAGAADTADPLGGSYFVEWLTRELELKTLAALKAVEGGGGMARYTMTGFSGEETDRPAPGEAGRRREGAPEAVLPAGPAREKRGGLDASSSLIALAEAVGRRENPMPFLVSAALSHATLGEMSAALREAFRARAPRS